MKDLSTLLFDNVHEVNESQLVAFVSGDKIAKLMSDEILISESPRKPSLIHTLMIAKEMQQKTYLPTNLTFKISEYDYHVKSNKLLIQGKIKVHDGMHRVSALEYLNTKMILGDIDVNLENIVFHVTFLLE